jgi:hypothetical protein
LPLDVTNAPQIGDQAAGAIASGATTAANTVSKSLSGVGQAVQSSEGNLVAAGTSWLSDIFASATNLLVRSGFILIGLVVLLGVFVFFYADSQKGNTTTVVPIPV